MRLADMVRAILLLSVVNSGVAASPDPVAIVALGDSLVAGHGLGPGESFPEQLESALRARGHVVTVANAGNSGDTSSDALARLDWSVPPDSDIVIVAVGGNDALRGVDPAVTKSALSQTVSRLKARGQAVLLAGMMAPRNLGEEYAAAFDAIYPDVAAQHGVALYPFFLEGVATDMVLNQADGMHPSAEGVRKIVESILPQVEALVTMASVSD
jgi:acyl-CoA thioesterase-1